MFTKAKIYNLALSALLLQRQITDTDNDKSNESKVLNTWYDIALAKTLEDLNLDSTVSQITLELVETDPVDEWSYAYKYPPNCLLFRRIKSSALCDNRASHIDKRVGIFEDKKVIFTNEVDAVAECVVNDVALSKLSASAGVCVSLRLAMMAAPLITGKGSKSLMETLGKNYSIAKAEAQEQDRLENFMFNDDSVDSEFVQARLE